MAPTQKDLIAFKVGEIFLSLKSIPLTEQQIGGTKHAASSEKQNAMTDEYEAK